MVQNYAILSVTSNKYRSNYTKKGQLAGFALNDTIDID